MFRSRFAMDRVSTKLVLGMNAYIMGSVRKPRILASGKKLSLLNIL